MEKHVESQGLLASEDLIFFHSPAWGGEAIIWHMAWNNNLTVTFHVRSLPWLVFEEVVEEGQEHVRVYLCAGYFLSCLGFDIAVLTPAERKTEFFLPLKWQSCQNGDEYFFQGW